MVLQADGEKFTEMNKKHILWWMGGGSPLLTSLISYWKFDSDANDSVGSNNGAVTGCGTTTGIIGNCYTFSAGAQYITVTDAANLSFGDNSNDSAFSFSAWVYPTNFAATRFLLSKRGASGTAQAEYSVAIDTSGKINFGIFSQLGATAYLLNTSNVALTSGAWNHVVITYSGSKTFAGLKVYKNGVLSTGDTNNSTGSYVAMNNGTANLVLGNNSWNQSQALLGNLDEVGLWGKELSQSDITSLYNSGAGRQYPF